MRSRGRGTSYDVTTDVLLSREARALCHCGLIVLRIVDESGSCIHPPIARSFLTKIGTSTKKRGIEARVLGEQHV